MTLIDQRILIDAPTDSVWLIVSDPNRMRHWHSGYKGVSVLTTMSGGVGSRRRCTLLTGKDAIEEITAWVEGLGYEYKVIDGGPYRAMQGRIRLQAGPDGTTVQWTISYQAKGLVSAIKNRLSGRHAVMVMMADSLRRLRREVDAQGIRMDADHRAKVTIRARLNADERAQYQRRHAPPPEVESMLTTVKPAVPAAEPEPSFVSTLIHEEEADYAEHTADTKPKRPAGLDEAIAAQQAAQAAKAEIPPEIPPEDRPYVRPPDIPTTSFPTPAHGIPIVIPEDKPRPVVLAPAPPEPIRPTPMRGTPIVQPPEEPAAPRPGLPPPTPKTDTGEMSIWEVFGMRRPSDANQDALDYLVKSVQSRQRATRRINGRGLKRPARARYLKTAAGLRLRLIMEALRVRSYYGNQE